MLPFEIQSYLWCAYWRNKIQFTILSDPLG